MKKLFTLLIVLLLCAGSSWGQSNPFINNIPEKKVVKIDAGHDPVPPAPLGILQGGEDISTAFVISSLPFTEIGTTAGYVDNYNEVCPYTATGGLDVVYSYTPSADGAIDISLCNDATAYDTKLYVYDTPTPVTGDAIACNDDLCSTLSYPSPYVSELTGVPVTAGTTYYIVVDGFSSSDYGAYEISVTGGIAYPIPPNDDCTGATVVSGTFPQTVTGTTLGATVDCPGLLDWNAVWYAVTLPYTSNNMTVDWCGTANMASVGVVYYTTCPVVCANYILYNSNIWQWCGIPTTGDETALTSYLNIAGPATIYYPAYSIPQMDHVITFNVTDASATLSCGNTNLGLITPTTTAQTSAYSAGDTYYWSFNATANVPYTFSSCGAGEDTYLRIYDPSLALVAENDDNGPHCATAEASIDYTPTVSGLYYVSLAAWSCNPLANPGNLVYYYSLTAPECGTTNLGLITPTTTPQTAAYTAGSTYYWSFNANAGEVFTFSDCGGLFEDSYIRILNASFLQIASADDSGPHCTGVEASIDWTAPASGLYYVSLAHYSCINLVNSDNFTYYYVPVPTCPVPTLLTAIPATIQAQLGWTENGTATLWDIEYGATPYTYTGAPTFYGVTNPYTLLGLIPETEYTYKVRADCGTETSAWSGALTFTTAPTCPPPTNPFTSDITTTSAVLNWTPPPIMPDSFFDVFWGEVGFDPATEGTLVTGVTSPYPLTPLQSGTNYEWYVRGNCGEFDDPDIDNFWMSLDPGSNLVPGSGGTMDDPYEDGTWYLYDQIPGVQWYNIWFYNEPVNINRMKIIRMGFWIQPYEGGSGQLSFVVNWSDSLWPGPSFPTPMDEAHIVRSATNGPIPINGPQWIELYYEIPNYNPEWVSVDIWGENIAIFNDVMSPPPGSPLLEWWKPYMFGGIIVHECLPKPDGNTSTWLGPVSFTTTFVAPLCENFDAMAIIGNDILPGGWKTESPSGLPWYSGDAASNGFNGPCSSPNFVYVDWYPFAVDKFLITPGIALTAFTPYNFTFNWVGDGYDGWTGDIMVNTNQTGVGATVIGSSFVVATTTTTATCIPELRTFTPSVSGTYYFMVRVNNNGVPYYLGFDDFCIAPPCITNTWTGAVSNAWNVPGNWSCGMLPDATTSVIVPTGLTTYPEIPFGVTVNCFDISVEIGANISIFGTLNVVNP